MAKTTVVVGARHIRNKNELMMLGAFLGLRRIARKDISRFQGEEYTLTNKDGKKIVINVYGSRMDGGWLTVESEEK